VNGCAPPPFPLLTCVKQADGRFGTPVVSLNFLFVADLHIHAKIHVDQNLIGRQVGKIDLKLFLLPLHPVLVNCITLKPAFKLLHELSHGALFLLRRQ
jgi:hypothetical protein